MNSLLIGKKAPAFKASAVFNGQIVSDFSLDLFLGRYVLLFFYPLDFTFVCPTELHAFQNALEIFQELDAEIVGCSVDSPYCHLAWLNTPVSRGGIAGVTYPLIADMNKEVARSYHVLNEEVGIAFRGLFVLDKQGIVRHQLVNDLPIGRSVAEALRVLEALIFHEQNGEVCPANWKKGEKAMKPTQEGLEVYFN
ncbi:MAG: peroxiredoxin [Verrucomicrobia bacterium]|nr:peroxiredoxin [Verrucomicrobiota bacterium]